MMIEAGITAMGSGLDLGATTALESAIWVSLFSDARVEDSPAGKRGFWGDALTGHSTGSKLWLLSRSKRRAETLSLYEDYAKQALQWLIDDGHVSLISVAASYQAAGVFLAVRLNDQEFAYAF